MKIKTLTHEEIQTLQKDAALRLIGEHTKTLSQINHNISQALLAVGKARIDLERHKNDKQTLVEMIRALKTMVDAA